MTRNCDHSDHVRQDVGSDGLTLRGYFLFAGGFLNMKSLVLGYSLSIRGIIGKYCE